MISGKSANRPRLEIQFEGHWYTLAELALLWKLSSTKSSSNKARKLGLQSRFRQLNKPSSILPPNVVITGEDFKRMRELIDSGLGIVKP